MMSTPAGTARTNRAFAFDVLLTINGFFCPPATFALLLPPVAAGISALRAVCCRADGGGAHAFASPILPPPPRLAPDGSFADTAAVRTTSYVIVHDHAFDGAHMALQAEGWHAYVADR